MDVPEQDDQLILQMQANDTPSDAGVYSSYKDIIWFVTYFVIIGVLWYYIWRSSLHMCDNACFGPLSHFLWLGAIYPIYAINSITLYLYNFAKHLQANIYRISVRTKAVAIALAMLPLFTSSLVYAVTLHVPPPQYDYYTKAEWKNITSSPLTHSNQSLGMTFDLPPNTFSNAILETDTSNANYTVFRLRIDDNIVVQLYAGFSSTSTPDIVDNAPLLDRLIESGTTTIDHLPATYFVVDDGVTKPNIPDYALYKHSYTVNKDNMQYNITFREYLLGESETFVSSIRFQKPTLTH